MRRTSTRWSAPGCKLPSAAVRRSSASNNHRVRYCNPEFISRLPWNGDSAVISMLVESCLATRAASETVWPLKTPISSMRIGLKRCASSAMSTCHKP